MNRRGPDPARRTRGQQTTNIPSDAGPPALHHGRLSRLQPDAEHPVARHHWPSDCQRRWRRHELVVAGCRAQRPGYASAVGPAGAGRRARDRVQPLHLNRRCLGPCAVRVTEVAWPCQFTALPVPYPDSRKGECTGSSVSVSWLCSEQSTNTPRHITSRHAELACPRTSKPPTLRPSSSIPPSRRSAPPVRSTQTASSTLAGSKSTRRSCPAFSSASTL